MVGFLDGPQGIYNGEYCIVDDKLMDCYRNSGGFDMIGSGRHKIEKPEEFKAAMENCIALNLDGESQYRYLTNILSGGYYNTRKWQWERINHKTISLDSSAKKENETNHLPKYV